VSRDQTLKPNLSEIDQSAAELLVILQIFAILWGFKSPGGFQGCVS